MAMLPPSPKLLRGPQPVKKEPGQRHSTKSAKKLQAERAIKVPVESSLKYTGTIVLTVTSTVDRAKGNPTADTVVSVSDLSTATSRPGDVRGVEETKAREDATISDRRLWRVVKRFAEGDGVPVPFRVGQELLRRLHVSMQAQTYPAKERWRAVRYQVDRATEGQRQYRIGSIAEGAAKIWRVR
jgi:hypothetical protein